MIVIMILRAVRELGPYWTFCVQRGDFFFLFCTSCDSNYDTACCARTGLGVSILDVLCSAWHIYIWWCDTHTYDDVTHIHMMMWHIYIWWCDTHTYDDVTHIHMMMWHIYILFCVQRGNCFCRFIETII